MFMDKRNRDDLLNEIWLIILEESGKANLSEKAQRQLDVLETKIDNALGINEEGIKRHITYGL
jgi:hypothetical protein|tara:strand:- start:1175 stop:1363 length:189 start_codon:yes stop_codon:yes gene_type:complete